MRWPGWPFRVAVAFDVTFGPVHPEGGAPEVDQKIPIETDVSYHEGHGELGLTPRR